MGGRADGEGEKKTPCWARRSDPEIMTWAMYINSRMLNRPSLPGAPLFLCFKFTNDEYTKPWASTLHPNKSRTLGPRFHPTDNLTVWPQAFHVLSKTCEYKPFFSKVFWWLLLTVSCSPNMNHKGQCSPNTDYREAETSTKQLSSHNPVPILLTKATV